MCIRDSAEAKRIVESARAHADELEATGSAERRAARERHEAELAAERERAENEAARIKQAALDIATARLARSRELAAQADRSRQDVATNLERLRNRIADLPELLVRPDDVDYNARTDADDRALLDERLSQPAR